MLLAEVTTTGFLARECIVGDEFAHGDEVIEMDGLVEFNVQALARTWNKEVRVKFLAELVDELDALLKTFLGAPHANVLPANVTQLLVD